MNKISKALTFLTLLSMSIACSKPTDSKALTESPTTTPNLSDAPSITDCKDNTFNTANFSLGRINSQQGWESAIGEAFDEQIEDIGTQACRGDGVWRIGNAYGSGGFGNQPRSFLFTKANGESDIRAVGAGDSMYYSFYFKTKSGVADSSAVDVSFASGPSTDRLDLIRISNAADGSKGLQILVRDGAALTTHEAAINISRGVWHHLKVAVRTPDGFSNDIQKIYLDGVLVGTFTTWENYRQANGQTNNLTFSRVMFRIPATIQVPSAAGIYIDDFEQVSFDSSAPTTVIESYKTGFEN